MDGSGRLRRWMDERGFKNFPALAKAMRKGGGLPSSKTYGELNLKNQLILLNKGETVWWRNQRVALDRLSVVLEIDPKELLGGRTVRASSGVQSFPEWQELRGIDLRRLDVVLELGLARSLDGGEDLNLYGELPRRGASWVHMPPGSGRSLVVALQMSRREAGEAVEAVSVKDLTEVVAKRRALPESEVLVAEVASFDPDLDAAVAGEAAGLSGLWVLSRSSALPPSAGMPAWARYAWNPPSDWTASYIGWLGERLGGDRPWPEALALTHEVDARRGLPLTPRDVLLLARVRIERSGDTNSCLNRAAQRLVSLAISPAVLDPAGRAWADACGWEALESALTGRWERWRWPWRGALTQAQWREVIPSRLAPPSRRDSGGHIEANEAMAVRLLVRGGLLVPDAAGALHACSTLVAEAVGRKAAALDLGRAIRGEGLADSGLRGLGRDRRPLLDAACADLTVRELVAVARHLSLATRPASDEEQLGLRALGDAIFVAIGLKLGGGDDTPTSEERPALERLFARAWSGRLQLWEGRHGVLATRPGPWDGLEAGFSDEGNAFLAACWGWSVALGRPKVEFAPSDAGLFPGWFDRIPSTPHVAEPPGWSSARQAADSAAPWPAFERLLAMRAVVVPKLEAGSVEGAGGILRAPLLVHRALRDEPFPFAPNFPSLDAFDWSGRWVDDLATSLSSLHEDDRRRVASYLLQHAAHDASAAGASGPKLIHRLRVLRRFGPVGIWVRDSLDLQDLEACRDRFGLWSQTSDTELVDLLHWLRTDQARILLDWLSADREISDLGTLLLSWMDRWHDPALLVHAALRLAGRAWAAYRRLWEIDPEEAMAHGQLLLESREGKEGELLHQFLSNVPLEHAERAASLLESLTPARLPHWTPVWAHRALARGGGGPLAAWRLLRASSSPPRS